jgi:hypothetical protein
MLTVGEIMYNKGRGFLHVYVITVRAKLNFSVTCFIAVKIKRRIFRADKFL